jgi:hypothetical protein
MPPVGFEPAIPASEWPQTHALDRAAVRIGIQVGLGEVIHTHDVIQHTHCYWVVQRLTLLQGAYNRAVECIQPAFH